MLSAIARCLLISIKKQKSTSLIGAKSKSVLQAELEIALNRIQDARRSVAQADMTRYREACDQGPGQKTTAVVIALSKIS